MTLGLLLYGNWEMSFEHLVFHKAWVNGQWTESNSGKTFAVVDPASGHELARVPDLDAQDTRNAINVADQAFKSWKNQTAKERFQLLKNWHQLIIDNQPALAELMTMESGKPLTESMDEVLYGASFIEWFAEQGKRIDGDVIQTPSSDRRIITLKQPVGVCAAITPWNFPLAMITRKCAPALAVGCTVVIKPAEATPLTALALAKLAQDAGIPDGVVNVVTASHGKEVGEELTRNPIIKKISFTGSTPVGKLLMKQSADTVKKVSMELGGNAPFIVFDDADIDAAVQGAVTSKYRNTGQTCVCANRILVQEGVYEEFVTKFADAVSNLAVGPGTNPDVAIGPVINQAALNKIQGLVDDALNRGAKTLVGGTTHELGGNFFQPTVLAGVTSDMRVAKEEIFGPIAPVFTFKDDQEAIELANDTEFGLASYFYSNNLPRVWKVAEQLEYGMVGLNVGIIANEVAPFGGIKESGLGREGSKYGVDDYLELKYMCLGGL